MRHLGPILSPPLLTAALALAGGPASAASGGPDAFGYSFVDQDDGAVYNYVDITMTGSTVVTGDDLANFAILGAPFEFYGAPVLSMVAGTNGFLTDDAASAFDTENDCPLPATPGTGGGYRLYPLHDDLVTTVRYQYFDEVEAGAVGYPGELAGISVFQWTGSHFGSGQPVDVEVILFHDDFSILSMVATDGEQGYGSTIGLQDDTNTLGITYSCDDTTGVVPGATAVLYTLQAPPDSDCCTESPTDAPGCTNAPCWAAVCDGSPACCTTDWDAGCAAAAQDLCPVLCGAPPAININEIRISQVGTDDDEYIELVGPGGTPLTDVQYIVLGDVPTGEIEEVIDLTGHVIPPSGYFVIADTAFSLGTADYTANINFEDDQTVTHLLVGGFTAQVLDNLDGNGDGVLDSTPWSTTFDTVAVIQPGSPLLPYGPGSSCMEGPLCQQVDDGIDGPFQIYRCDDGDGTWQIGNQDLATVPATDSPGGHNTCGGATCGDGVVDAGEDCDDGGESAACNIDCTLPACGDGVYNGIAGETCDDGGESVSCNADCTAAVCGDGQVNMTAGETCDDGNTEDGDECPANCGDDGMGTGSTGDTTGTTGDATGTTGDATGTTGDATDTTGGADTTGTTGGATGGADTTGGPVTSNGSGPVTLTSGVGPTGGPDDTDTAGATPGDDGCGCATGGSGGMPWSGLLLLVAAGVRRRRRPTSATR